MLMRTKEGRSSTYKPLSHANLGGFDQEVIDEVLEKDSQDTDSEEDEVYKANELMMTMKGGFGILTNTVRNLIPSKRNSMMDIDESELPEESRKFNLAQIFMGQDKAPADDNKERRQSVAYTDLKETEPLDTVFDDGASDTGVNFK